jgi:hypothetical protein
VKARFQGPKVAVASLMHPRPSKVVRSDGPNSARRMQSSQPRIARQAGPLSTSTRYAGLSVAAGDEVGHACGEAEPEQVVLDRSDAHPRTDGTRPNPSAGAGVACARTCREPTGSPTRSAAQVRRGRESKALPERVRQAQQRCCGWVACTHVRCG